MTYKFNNDTKKSGCTETTNTGLIATTN